jgi:hypothetical protein
MTDSTDPPRLRKLAHSLPAELALSLEVLPDEEASFAELEQLALTVRSRAGFGEASPSSERAARKPRPAPARVAVFHGALGVAMLFALGAGAGVLVASGLFFARRSSSRGEAPPAASAVAPARSAPATSPARAPQHSALGGASGAPSPPLAPSAAPSVGSFAAEVVASSTEEPGSAAELGLLGRAQALLDTDAVRALALTSDHERKFPNGALVQEREVIVVDALLRLGRRADAETRAADFHRRFPASVHGRRVDVLLGVAAP